MSNKYKNILNNKEGKVILANFSYLFLLQIAGYLFPLLTMPYLARVIGADGFGRIAIASAVIMWIQTISDWGFNYTATRDVAKNRDDNDKVSHILSNVIWAKFILLFFSYFSRKLSSRSNHISNGSGPYIVSRLVFPSIRAYEIYHNPKFII